MPESSSTTQLKFFEHCQRCGAVFSDSLIRIPQMTEAVKKLTEYCHAMLYQRGADLEYLDKQFAIPLEKVIANMLHPVECPDCHMPSGGPTHEAQEAANALLGLMSNILSFSKILQALTT
jgi:hypothetical protein